MADVDRGGVPEYAKVSAFRNNCAFHCFALAFFSLSREKIKEIEHANPEIIKKLCEEFKRYYAIDDKWNVNLDFILQFVKTLHPFELEIIFGSVFRNVLTGLIKSFGGEPSLVSGYTLIGEDGLTPLANAFSAKLDITYGAEKRNNLFKQELPNPLWSIDLHRFAAGGGHWDLNFSEPGRNVTHNARFSLEGEPIGCEQMLAAVNTVGVREQTDAIGIIVHTHAEVVNRILEGIENAKELAKQMGGVELLWHEVFGDKAPLSDQISETEALNKIVEQQMQIEMDLNKGRSSDRDLRGKPDR